MLPEQIFNVAYDVPICAGTGFLALDVVMNGHPKIPLGTWAGGSCGNVLTILSYLGWKSLPIARVGNDSSARKLLRDLILWGVDTKLIFQDYNDKTPVVIEKLIVGKNGKVRNKFVWECPSCGTKLPGYKVVRKQNFEQRHPNDYNYVNVFYFDRVGKNSIEIAKYYKNKGALIIFEPSSIKDRMVYLECLRVADIVKYSVARIGDASNLHEQVDIPLEIQTLGSKGLRYKWSYNSKSRDWVIMQSYKVVDLKDSVGSGDWCTAGIIHILGQYGKAGFAHFEQTEIEFAISFGQALAALNCYYEGARGVMYSLTKKHFKELINSITDGQSPLNTIYDDEIYINQPPDVFTCPFCEKSNKSEYMNSQ